MTEPARTSLALPQGTVSCLDWRGEGPFVHFAHATGFNAQTYKGLLDPLSDRFRIIASDQRGHGLSTLPVRPGLAKGWHIYSDDLVAILRCLYLGPAILVGHSMGATVSLMAAHLQPDLVQGLVLLEPVLIPGWARWSRWFTRTAKIARDGDGLAARAAQRRDRFPSFEAALESYTGRGAFRTWSRETIADYVRGGLIADPATQSLKLACSPAWEAETFRATPTGTAGLARRIACPIILVKGTVRSTCLNSEAEQLRRAGAHVVTADGASHFLPMEYPELVRHEIERMAVSL